MDRKTMVGDVMVSTVLLPSIAYPQITYETCIFWDKAVPHTSRVVDRYTTFGAAEAGHDHWCAKVMNGEVTANEED